MPGVSGFAIGFRLASLLQDKPWQKPDRSIVKDCRLFMPQKRFKALPDYRGTIFPCLCESLAKEVKEAFHAAAAHIFLGSCGLAIRLIAPCLLHKSLDPPVLAISPDGSFVIPLLSGHWGGGNSLARHLGAILGAQPVITTQSDNIEAPALDLFLQAHGMRILDWALLPRFQAELAAGAILPLHDPFRRLPDCAFLEPLIINSESAAPNALLVKVDWRASARGPNVLRASPALYIGIGFRKNVNVCMLATALDEFLEQCDVDKKAIAGLGTVQGKENVLAQLGEMMHIPIFVFDPPYLAKIPVSHPSLACGRRFGQEPFSVCEGAALAMISTKNNASGRLLVHKFIWKGVATFAIAMADAGPYEKGKRS